MRKMRKLGLIKIVTIYKIREKVVLTEEGKRMVEIVRYVIERVARGN
jgi:Mn-dependent DtxR family transcriptional regulator